MIFDIFAFMANVKPPTTPDAVRQWRRDTGRISQADTATLLGVSPRSVWAFEAGERPIPAWYGWALLGAHRAIKSQILGRKRRARFNAKRNATRGRVQRIRRTHRKVQHLNHHRLDVLARIVDRGMTAGPEEMAVLRDIGAEIHGLEESLPRRMRG